MPEIAVIIPAWLHVPSVLDRFRQNLATFDHPQVRRVFVICNRLTLMSASDLHRLLSKCLPAPVQVVHEIERSVAGAWNRGVELALDAGADHILISAVDVELQARTIDTVLEFGATHPEVHLWSSTAHADRRGPPGAAIDRCDFSCAMLRRSAIERHGWFDREYEPAYFEDNDYITRVALGGGKPKQVLDARHRHDWGLTGRLDAEVARRVNGRFARNRARFLAKWKTLTDDYPRIPDVCFRTPYGMDRPLSWWPEQDRAAYSLSGGIAEGAPARIPAAPQVR